MRLDSALAEKFRASFLTKGGYFCLHQKETANSDVIFANQQVSTATGKIMIDAGGLDS